MRTLILMRHATSVAINESLNDYVRPLTSIGRFEASQQAEFLTRQWPLDCIIASSALRTSETALIIASTMQRDIALSLHPELHQARFEHYLPFLARIPLTTDSALLIGHNPAISELIEYLTDKEGIYLAPAGLCLLQSPKELDWNAWSRGSAHLLSRHEAHR